MTRMPDGATILLTAAVTMVAATALLWPAGLNAVDQPVPLRVVRPTLSLGALQFTVEALPTSAEPGAEPALTVKVANGGDATAEARIWLVASASRPESEISRRPVIQRTVWTHDISVVLAPRASQTLTVPIDAALPAGESITISVADKEPAAAKPVVQAMSQEARQLVNSQPSLVRQVANAAPEAANAAPADVRPVANAQRKAAAPVRQQVAQT